MKLWMIDENSRKYSIFQIMLSLYLCRFVEIDVYIHDLSNLLLIVK